MQIEQKTKLFFIFLSPLPDSQGDIFLQTLTVQPWFATMDITDIKKVSEGRILCSAIAFHHQHVVLWVEGHGDRVVENGWGGINTPVDGVNTHTGLRQYRFHILHVFHGVVADGDTDVYGILSGSDARTFKGVLRGHLIAQHIGCDKMLIGFVAHVFQQFHDSKTALTEPCQHKGATGVPHLQKLVEGFFTSLIANWTRCWMVSLSCVIQLSIAKCR